MNLKLSLIKNPNYNLKTIKGTVYDLSISLNCISIKIVCACENFRGIPKNSPHQENLCTLSLNSRKEILWFILYGTKIYTFQSKLQAIKIDRETTVYWGEEGDRRRDVTADSLEIKT